MSKLLEMYKKSPFSELGKKILNQQNEKNIPNIEPISSKSILDAQKDFYELAIKPYKTILHQHSSIGNITVNPKMPVIDLFDTMNSNVQLISISDTSNLLSMPRIIPIYEFETGNLLKKSKIYDIINIKNSSVLGFNIPEIVNLNSSKLIDSKLINISNFESNNILNLNSNFDDIVNSKITSVLDKKSQFSNVVDLPYSNILGLNSKFDDLVIKSAGSVLTQYIVSGLSETVPGIVNFFNDIYNTGFIPNASLEESFYNFDKIPSISTEMINKEKSTIDIVPMIETPEKVGKDVINNIMTPEKVGKDVINNIMTPEKVGKDVINNIMTPEKVGKDVTKNIPDFNKKLLQIPILGSTNYISDTYAKGFTLNSKFMDTQYNTSSLPSDYIIKNIPDFNKKLLQIPILGSTNYISDTYAKGFTLNSKFMDTQYNTSSLPSDYIIENIPDFNKILSQSSGSENIQQFNFNDSSYGGVLNQYAIYFSKYPPLTNVTYKTVIDWAYNRIVRVPEALELERKGLHTPTVKIGQTQLINPPYQSANERLPIWANTYTNTLEDVGSTLVSGFLSNQTIDLMNKYIIDGSNTMKLSSLIIQQLAGEVYYNYSNLGTQIRNVREVAINYTSNLVGYKLANMFIPKVESTIGGITSDIVNSTLNATLLDSDKVLMLYHILMGTKYTKSKAYFDRLKSEYSSISDITGLNAVNLYNDKLIYASNPNINISNGSNLIDGLINYVNNNNNNNNTDGINDKSALKSLLNKVESIGNDDNKILPINNGSGLKNPYLTKRESITFNGYNTYLTTESININYSNTKLDLNNEAPASNRDTYTKLLQNKLKEIGSSSLYNRGLSDNGDLKNKLPLTKINDESYYDIDLIDFYFEDLSSYSDSGKSVLIPFRAIITNISDGVTADWSAQDYVGRADKFWIYQGFTRTIGLDFEIAINSKNEFKSSWNKLNYLQGLCYPVSYPSEISLKAPIMALTVGNLFERIQIILTSFNTSFDGTTLWEIEKGYQLPTYIKVSLSFTVLFADIPKTSGKHYAQKQNWISPDIHDIQEYNNNIAVQEKSNTFNNPIDNVRTNAKMSYANATLYTNNLFNGNINTISYGNYI